MSQYRALWLVAYDISADRERSRVEKVLKGWGCRVQKSVWSVVTGRAGISRLISELEQLGMQTGQVLVFRLVANARVAAVGRPYEDPDVEIAYLA